MTSLHTHSQTSRPFNTLQFIVSDNIHKEDLATRKLIRSHVMRGKKASKNLTERNTRSTTPGPKSSIKSPYIELGDVADLYSPVPRRVGSDFSLGAAGVESHVLFNITKVSTVAMRVIFPLLTAIGFQFDTQEWLHRVTVDPAALHISAYAIETFKSRILRREQQFQDPSPMVHFQKGIELLQERLQGDDDSSKISDATIATVVKLAGAAHFDGDYETARKHMQGLRRMVDLRGGMDALKGDWILVELTRCDLGIALLNGADALFYCRPNEVAPEYPPMLLTAAGGKTIHGGRLCTTKDLETAWQAMRSFCLQVNIGTQTQRFVHPDIIYDTMTAVMYRLLPMSFASGSLNELVRQGLLAFSYHIFLQWQDIRPPYEPFRETYKDCILAFHPGDEESSRFMLWLILVGAISLFDVSDETWLRDLLREYVDRCGVSTWTQMVGILKSFMWIPFLDDRVGKSVYESVSLGVKRIK